MTREEEIINAAKTFEKEEGFSPIVMKAKGVNSAAGIGFLEGAMWADQHPKEGMVSIDKVCEWLEQYTPDYIQYFIEHNFAKFYEDCKKAMKGE